ncbi:MAG: DUF2156 domain-containing protein [Clostridia bacterium]|nr:DUF2156 domain-containing protein [Clostridia bacterium]
MLEFQDVTIENRERVNEYLKNVEEPFCDFTFGNLFSWSVVENTKIAFLNNFLFIRFSDENKYYYSFPIGKGEIKNEISEIIKDAEINNKKIRFVCLNKKQADVLKNIFGEKIRIEKNRNSFDYIYSVEKLSSLRGRKLHSKKNHFNSFMKSYDYIYEKINEENIKECISFVNEWYEQNAETPELLKEQKVLNKALSNFFELKFIGAVIKINNKIVAFCAGEEMRENIFCTHFEKAVTEIPTAYTAINKLFSENTLKKFLYVNREDDAGIDGLRKAKLSYQPETILEKYYAEFKN